MGGGRPTAAEVVSTVAACIKPNVLVSSAAKPKGAAAVSGKTAARTASEWAVSAASNRSRLCFETDKSRQTSVSILEREIETREREREESHDECRAYIHNLPRRFTTWR